MPLNFIPIEQYDPFANMLMPDDDIWVGTLEGEVWYSNGHWVVRGPVPVTVAKTLIMTDWHVGQLEGMLAMKYSEPRAVAIAEVPDGVIIRTYVFFSPDCVLDARFYWAAVKRWPGCKFFVRGAEKAVLVRNSAGVNVALIMPVRQDVAEFREWLRERGI